MFFNVNGIKWTLLAIAVVVLLCALDVHCSNVRDEKRKATVGGSIAHVKDEWKAGQHEFALQRAEQINAQLRDLRIMAKHFVKNGETKRARATIALIQELEQQQKRLQKKTD